MTRKFLAGALLGASLLAAACSKAGQEQQAAPGAAARDDTRVMAIDNESGEVTLVLTASHVFMQLSEEKLEEIREEFRKEREQSGGSGLAESIKDMVLDKVEYVLSHRIEYAVEDINRVSWVDGELIFDVEKGSFLSFEDVKVDGDMALETFSEADALAFIEAFERVKSGR